MRQLPAAAASLTFSPTGGLLAVGLHQGGTLVLDAASLERVCSGLHGRGQAPSRALAFSPDGTMLAVGTDAGTIEIYAVGGGWDRLGSCQGGHAAPVVAIDWAGRHRAPDQLAPSRDCLLGDSATRYRRVRRGRCGGRRPTARCLGRSRAWDAGPRRRADGDGAHTPGGGRARVRRRDGHGVAPRVPGSLGHRCRASGTARTPAR